MKQLFSIKLLSLACLALLLTSCFQADFGSGTTIVSGRLTDSRTGKSVKFMRINIMRLPTSFGSNSRYSLFDSVKTDTGGYYQYVFDADKSTTYKMVTSLTTLYASQSHSIDNGQTNQIDLSIKHNVKVLISVQNINSIYPKIEVDIPNRIFILNQLADTTLTMDFQVPETDINIPYFLYQTINTQVPTYSTVPLHVYDRDTNYATIRY
jgi:hypothetical protein